MASALAPQGVLGTHCKFATTSATAIVTPAATPLPIKFLPGSRFFSSSTSIRGDSLDLCKYGSRRRRPSPRKHVSAQLDDKTSLPAESTEIVSRNAEIVKSQESQSRGVTVGAYVAGLVLAAACSLAMPKAAQAKQGLAPPATSSQQSTSKIQIPQKRGVKKQNLDPDSVRTVPLPNRDGSLPANDERSAKLEARKQQVADFKRRVLREEATVKTKLEEDPKDEKNLQRLVDVQLMKNDYEGVKETLRKMIDYFPEDYRYRLMLTEVASGTRSLEEALEVAKAGTEKFPRTPEMIQTYSMMLLANDDQQGALAFARQKVAEATKTESTEENGKEFATGMKLLLGQILSALGDFEEAHSHFSEMIESDPSDFRPRVSKGLLFQLKGQTEAAEAQFSKVMELLPADFPEREAVVAMIETARQQKSFTEGDEGEEEAEAEAEAERQQAESAKLRESAERSFMQDKSKAGGDKPDQPKEKKKGWKLW